MKVAVMGSTGYIGSVLLRILLNHPNVSEIYPVSRSTIGNSVLEEDPGISPESVDKLKGCNGKYISAGDVPACDVVFAALPHLKSAELAAPFIGKSVVIDLSADFRISDPALFKQAYKVDPPNPELLDSAVYGLSEWYRDSLRSADLIANPGCYPTATLLPLLPLAKEGLIGGDVVVNALTGISGAGKKAKEHLLYTSRTENAAAYMPGRSHRHYPEIFSQLKSWSGEKSAELYFTPHLIPMHHGMEVTTSFELAAPTDHGKLVEIFNGYYGDSPFVRLRSSIPETSQVRSTNRCDFYIHLEGSRIFLISAIDNLYKGASGQAIQNMNIRFGLEESAGLRLHGEI